MLLVQKLKIIFPFSHLSLSQAPASDPNRMGCATRRSPAVVLHYNELLISTKLPFLLRKIK